MKSKILISLMLLPLVLTAVALQPVGTSLVKRAKAGDVFKYRTTISLTAEGEKIEMVSTTTETVKEVASNGNLTIESLDSDMVIRMSGVEMKQDADESEKSTTVYRPNGEIVDYKANDASDADTRRMIALATVKVPDGAVTEGQKWTLEIAADAKTGVRPTKLEYEAVRVEKVGDHETMKILVKGRETEGSKPMTIESTLWISTKDGFLVKGELKMTNVSTGEGDEVVDLEGKLERI